MKKIVCVLLACALALGLAGCGQDANESEFECQDFKYLGENAEMGKMFEVGGIPYRELPETKWRPITWDGEYLGTVRNDPNNVYPGGLFKISRDATKIFAQLNTAKERHWYDDALPVVLYYYRVDVTLPPFDRTGIDQVGYVKRGQWFYRHDIKPITQDKETLDKLFEAIDTAPDNEYEEGGGFRFAEIWCMNSAFPGIGIELPIKAYHQSYWIELKRPDWTEGVYAKIPQEVLEAIAGEKLPTAEEFINGRDKPKQY
jgi:hypothetical protein